MHSALTLDELVAAVVEKHHGRIGALLPVLHDVQHRMGHVPAAAIPVIARLLGLSRAEVHGVMHFYHDFRDEPPGKHVVQVCRAEACQAMGGFKLEAHVKNTLGIDYGQTSADGRYSLEPVYCLGNCACTPTVKIDQAVHARVTPEGFDQLLAALRESAKPGQAEPGTAESRPVQPGPVEPGSSSDAAAVTPAWRVYVPMDTTAVALGADAVAAAVQAEADRRGMDVDLVRNGSRGAFWLEPLLEVEHAGVRQAFGPVTAEDVPGLFERGFPSVTDHPLSLGDVTAIPWLQRQQRLTFERAGLADPLSIDAYRAMRGFDGLERALGMTPQAIVDVVKDSGLRGRGGAAFPTGIKWQTVLDTPSEQKYIVCNADEGDSGTFADRLLMEADPYQLIEGMTIAALAVGATVGFIYLRSEYPAAGRILEQALARAEQAGWLGADIGGSGKAFRIELRIGAGAYICGEETSLLDSLEGKRGLVRFKPPLPAIEGLMGQPTVINNVLSFAAASTILARGARFYQEFGTGRSRGTLTVQLSGNIRRGGLVELAFGHSLRALVEDFGGDTLSGRPIRAIQLGGPLGTYLPESQWDVPLDYEALAAIGGMLGHGGVVVFDDTVDMARQARFAMEFCAIESCGKCTPCRVGSVRGAELLDRVIANDRRSANLALLEELCDTMVDGSLCAMGGLTPLPVRSALQHFAEDFQR